MKQKEISYLDLSGYMFSGKSAVSDLIREFEGFDVPDYHTEFDLIRISGGLSELRWGIVENWSPMRADASLRKFSKTIEKLARTPKGFKKLYQAGFGYEVQYPNIVEATAEFVNNLTEDSWDMKWPHSLLDLSPFDVFKTKLQAKIKGSFPWPEINFKIISADTFDVYAKQYIYRLLAENKNENIKTIVTHNALEPYAPEIGFPLFTNIKSIVIDRDVRDIYMTSITQTPGYNDEVSTFSKIAGSFDVDVFIARQKEMRKKIVSAKSDNVLRVNFEDFIFNYEATIDKLMSFLNVEHTIHTHKKEYFKPEKSQKNTRLWLNANDDVMKNIKKIENELKSYCYL